MNARNTAAVICRPIISVGGPRPQTPSVQKNYFPLSPELRALREPKSRVSGLRKGARFAFEQGGLAREISLLPGRYKLRQLPSGAMTIMEQECGRATFEGFARWQEEEGIRDLSYQHAVHNAQAIRRRLDSLGIDFTNNIGIPKREMIERGEAWRIINQTLSVLPDRVLANGELRRIVFGSQRIGAAQASAYDDHTVYIYYGAMQGARRELVAKVLHEIGHSTVDTLDQKTVARLKRAHRKLIGDFIGLDIMGGPGYRISYQKYFDEFVAEMHLIYVCARPLIQEKIDSHPKGSAKRQAWEDVYSIFRDQIFEGREYD